MAVIVIIGILAALLIPSFQEMKDRAGQAGCIANMRNITVALHGYLQDHENVWPQGPAPNDGARWETFWLESLQPYQINANTWQCPTLKSQLARVEEKDRPHVHYVPTTFGPKPNAANLYATHPWITERSSVHGQGALICFPDGSVKSFNKVLAEMGVQ